MHRASRACLALAAVFAAAACTSPWSFPPTGPPSPSTVGESCPQCPTSDGGCDEECADWATIVGQAREPSITFDAWSCIQLEVITGEPDAQTNTSGLACECAIAGTDGMLPIMGEDGYGCIRAGHTGNCLYWPSEFSGCTLGDDAACEAPCLDLQQRIHDDAATAYDVTVHSTGCDCGCACILQVEGECLPAPYRMREECPPP
jgi:hypothetical protein